MKIENLPVGATDWSQMPASVQSGESGIATARELQFGDIQLRLVDYSAGYVAKNWCPKGHIVFVVAGRLTVEHQDGQQYLITPNMTYQVSDNAGSPHRARSDHGATLFIVD